MLSIICVRFVQKSKNKLNKLFEYGALIPWLLPSTLIALGLTMAYGDQNPLIFNKVLVGTTVILLILIIGGFIMLSLGIIGHYLARIYEEVKGRPRYIISKVTDNITGNVIGSWKRQS